MTFLRGGSLAGWLLTSRREVTLVADQITLTVLGTATCTPEAGRDSSCYCVNGSLLVDAGWNVVAGLSSVSLDPLDIDALIVTHCHHDHYMGIVGLLFYLGLEGRRVPEKRFLHVYGPAGEIGRVVEDAQRFLQTDRYPELEFPVEVHDVAPGDQFSECGLQVKAVKALHNVPSLCYRVENASGTSVTFSGDTPFNPALVELARGTDLLLHEMSFGPNSTRGKEGAAHSGSPEAAEVAALAGARQLALVHGYVAAQAASLAAAQKRFPATFIPKEGDVLQVGG